MPKALFQIQTTHEVFYHNLHNWHTEPMIRGNLVLFPHSPITIQQIQMRFIGRVIIKQPCQRFQKILIEKSWNFIPEQGPSCIFGPQAYSFGFQFEFPGELPESHQTPDGKIEYVLYATAKTSLFRTNLKTKKIIPVRKILGPVLGGIHCRGFHKELIEYDVQLPTLEFNRGDHFRVNFKFRLLQEKILPTFIACGLREQVIYRMPMDEFTTHKVFEESWVMATVESYEVNQTEKSLLLKVPHSPENIQHSYQSDFIEISHFLYAQIQFPGINVQVSFPVLITRKDPVRPVLPPAYEDSYTLPPPYQLSSLQHVVSRMDQQLVASRKPIITAISQTVKHARRLSIPNPISVLSH